MSDSSEEKARLVEPRIHKRQEPPAQATINTAETLGEDDWGIWDTVFVFLMAAYAVLTPLSKVEESFNAQVARNQDEPSGTCERARERERAFFTYPRTHITRGAHY